MPDIITRIQHLLGVLYTDYKLEITHDSIKLYYEFYSGIFGFTEYAEFFKTSDELEDYLIKELTQTMKLSENQSV